MRNWSTRDLVTVAVFGALWGAAEMSLGALLHALKLPLTGLAMTAIGLLIALTGYRFVPRRGAVLAIATVCSLLKALSVGSIVLSPMLAILIEGLLAELGLTLAGGGTGVVPLATAGAAGALWVPLHPFVSQGLLAGQGMIEIYRRLLASGARLLHLDPRAIPVIVIGLLVLHAGVGAIAGALAHGLGRQLAHRLRAGEA
jgi:hypothetical protein